MLQSAAVLFNFLLNTSVVSVVVKADTARSAVYAHIWRLHASCHKTPASYDFQ
jgi:hypothetical protein